jgi:hypothetical protein
MAVTAKQIKMAAETIDGLSAVVASQRAALKTANEKIAALEASKTSTAKTASEADTKRLMGLAKKAAACLHQNGLISTPERAESFAREIMDPSKALIALEKFAGHVGTVRKVAAVVEDTSATAAVESSDQVWDRHVSNFVPAAK